METFSKKSKLFIWLLMLPSGVFCFFFPFFSRPSISLRHFPQALEAAVQCLGDRWENLVNFDGRTAGNECHAQWNEGAKKTQTGKKPPKLKHLIPGTWLPCSCADCSVSAGVPLYACTAFAWYDLHENTRAKEAHNTAFGAKRPDGEPFGRSATTTGISNPTPAVTGTRRNN